MRDDISISVIMPGYNEGSVIYNNLNIVSGVLEKLNSDYEVIFVDDGSADNTVSEVQKASCANPKIKLIASEKNFGKGHALKLGTQAATKDLILFLDSDLDLSPEGIGLFIEILDKEHADVVIGSKLHEDSVISYPAIRRFISFGYYVFLLILFRLNVRDTQTGMKLFKADVIKPVMDIILVKRFAFDIEVLSVINQRGYKIATAPVVLEYGRTVAWGRMKLKDIFNVFVDTLAIFYRLYILKYYNKK